MHETTRTGTAAATASAHASPQGCTSFRLRQLQRTVAQRYDAALRRSGLLTTQYSLLTHLQGMGPCKPGELARALRMDASTLTRNLKPLVEQGWVKVGEGVDARSRLIRLTPQGLAKRQAARRDWRQAQESLNDVLGVERVVQLHRLIDEVQSLLDADGMSPADEN